MARIRRESKPPPVKPWRPQLPQGLVVGTLALAIAGLLTAEILATKLIALALIVWASYSLGRSMGEARPDPLARARIATLEAQRDYVQQLAVGTLVGLRRDGAPAPTGGPGTPAASQPEARPAPPVTTAQRNQRSLRSLDAALPGDEAGGVTDV